MSSNACHVAAINADAAPMSPASMARSMKVRFGFGPYALLAMRASIGIAGGASDAVEADGVVQAQRAAHPGERVVLCRGVTAASEAREGGRYRLSGRPFARIQDSGILEMQESGNLGNWESRNLDI